MLKTHLDRSDIHSMESTRAPQPTTAHAWNIFGTSPIPSVVVNLRDGRIVDANNAGARLFGLDRDTLLHRQLSEFVIEGATDLLAPEPRRCAHRCRLSTTTDHREAVLVDIAHADEYRAIMFLGDPAPTVPEELDSLTGLATRSALPAALARAIQTFGNSAGIAFIDLDNFKRVNDDFGHLQGDEVLIATARAITRVSRSGDTIIRFGGDEFVVILPQISSTMQASQFSERIRNAIAEANTAVGHTVTASIGVALFDRADDRADDRSDVAFSCLHAADVAMYEAKRSGGNRSVISSRQVLYSVTSLTGPERSEPERKSLRRVAAVELAIEPGCARIHPGE